MRRDAVATSKDGVTAELTATNIRRAADEVPRIIDHREELRATRKFEDRLSPETIYSKIIQVVE